MRAQNKQGKGKQYLFYSRISHKGICQAEHRVFLMNFRHNAIGLDIPHLVCNTPHVATDVLCQTLAASKPLRSLFFNELVYFNAA